MRSTCARFARRAWPRCPLLNSRRSTTAAAVAGRFSSLSVGSHPIQVHTMQLTSRVILASVVATAAGAQAPVKARPLGPINSISKETVGNVTGVRQLPNGSILVNDIGRRRLVLLDSTLQGSVVIADTAAGAPNMYGL